MSIEKKYKRLLKKQENFADTQDLLDLLSIDLIEKLYLNYVESKKVQLQELLEEIDVNDLKSSKKVIKELYKIIDSFKSGEKMGLNSSNYPNVNGIIYTLIGEIGETQYVMSIDNELYYLQESDFDRDISYDQMKAERCRSLHTNDMGKEMTEIRRLS